MSFLSLPLEVVVKILSHLKPEDLVNAILTCKSFHRAAEVSKLWKSFCERDYNVKKEDIGLSSYQEFYKKVLYPYGYLLGLWQMQIEQYGGLISVKVVDGEVIATQFLPPIDPEVWRPFKRKPLFKIYIGSEGKVISECLKGKGGPHKIKIVKGTSKEEFSVKCKKPETHHKGNTRNENFLDWIHCDLGIPQDHFFPVHEIELLRMKYLSVQRYDASCSFSSLQLTHAPPTVPIQPGLFKGTYGGHGIEIILLSYDGHRLQGTKVTGDPNVPAGQMSIDVHLDEPVVLTQDQQRSLHDLQQLDKEVHVVKEGQESPLQQPFAIPFGTEDRGLQQLCAERNIPTDVCKQRYLGTGLIAMHGFRNSSRTNCHFIVFNEDVFAFLWMELSSISIYCRAEDIS